VIADILKVALEKMSLPVLEAQEVIPWGVPILSFGDSSRATIATLGINPSNREFVDAGGKELDGSSRRFPTLKSLRLNDWKGSTAKHHSHIVESYNNYFYANPYSLWFNPLDRLLSRTGASYYSRLFPACHLDLVPFATSVKWGALKNHQQTSLLNQSIEILGLVLERSSIQTLVLNGAGVVKAFAAATGCDLKAAAREDWNLNRNGIPSVPGVAFSGELTHLAGRSVDRRIRILGYNHNIQSSFGVTKEVTVGIRNWLSTQSFKN
jgi:hypothetical protein